jgi:hypothetical protein
VRAFAEASAEARQTLNAIERAEDAIAALALALKLDEAYAKPRPAPACSISMISSSMRKRCCNIPKRRRGCSTSSMVALITSSSTKARTRVPRSGI